VDINGVWKLGSAAADSPHVKTLRRVEYTLRGPGFAKKFSRVAKEVEVLAAGNRSPPPVGPWSFQGKPCPICGRIWPSSAGQHEAGRPCSRLRNCPNNGQFTNSPTAPSLENTRVSGRIGRAANHPKSDSRAGLCMIGWPHNCS
jgi:hypothetical protein